MTTWMASWPAVHYIGVWVGVSKCVTLLFHSLTIRSTDYGSTFAQILHATTLYPKIYVAPNNNALVSTMMLSGTCPVSCVTNGYVITIIIIISTLYRWFLSMLKYHGYTSPMIVAKHSQ